MIWCYRQEFQTPMSHGITEVRRTVRIVTLHALTRSACGRPAQTVAKANG